ncbi:NirD/YgiW/YdeI family stress tolerance protein [Parendozoicomonas sp. Alg238-R29]|uniref:NirD/YgiW/YdeI family stress tolerance protein n=1 Tax=Parendozoicomonas sp. Alg238-R29 TaxID=2993446 RepID=UPI00248E53BE|nr:NirD/YgiW/YdeI family stress tolerance protein [Parendozoicomonas sp. Alg238-R29]
MTASLSSPSRSQQTVTPPPPHKVTVKEALSENHHGGTVDITGVVLRQIGPETILLHDGTAAIEVDVPPNHIPQSGLKPNTRIRIKGEVTHEDNGSHEVEANQVFWTF